MSVRHLAEVTCEQMAQRRQDILLLPLGSTEQHTTHLPMGTDTMMALAVAESAATQAGEEHDLVLAPPLPYGISGHHVFAGAASLRPATYYQVLLDLLGSLSESGFSRFFLLNGHGGNHDSLGVVAKSAPLDLGVSVAVCSYWNTVTGHLSDLGLKSDDLPGHSGRFETSLMLALRPDLVDMDRAPTARHDPPPVWHRALPDGLEVQVPGEWPRVAGYSEPATDSTEALGKDIFTRVSHGVAAAIACFARVADERDGQEGRHG
jgi:creatinine amidohydrolase